MSAQPALLAEIDAVRWCLDKRHRTVLARGIMQQWWSSVIYMCVMRGSERKAMEAAREAAKEERGIRARVDIATASAIRHATEERKKCILRRLRKRESENPVPPVFLAAARRLGIGAGLPSETMFFEGIPTFQQ